MGFFVSHSLPHFGVVRVVLARRVHHVCLSKSAYMVFPGAQVIRKDMQMASARHKFSIVNET